MNTKLVSGLFAAAVLLGSASAALAAPAVATGNVNVRAGASTGYPVISSLHYGQRVDVEYCDGGWCFVEKRGRDGWVSASYLALDHIPQRPRHRRHRDYYDYGYGYGNNHQVGISTCIGGGNASFCVGF